MARLRHWTTFPTLYPTPYYYPNSGYIRNANRSSQSLHASIKSHKGAVSNRIASRSRETLASKSRSPSPSPTQNSIHSRSSHPAHSFHLSSMGDSPASSTFGSIPQLQSEALRPRSAVSKFRRGLWLSSESDKRRPAELILVKSD
jgi:hypothetical protein